MADENFIYLADNGDVLKKNKETIQSFEDLGDKAEVVGNKIDKIFQSESPNEMKQIIDIQKKAIIDLEQQYKKSASAIAAAEKELSNMQPTQEKGLLSENLQKQKQALAELRIEIDGEKGALAQMNNELQNSDIKSTTLRTQIRNLKAQMANMTEGTEEYTLAMQQLGQMVDKMGDINQQGKAFADDEKYIRATTAAIQGLTGVVTASTGVMSLFGASQENIAAIQTKLQAVMAISIGIEQVAVQLNKDSYVMHILLPKAKAMDAAATANLTGMMTALGISTGVATVAARAFLITITGGLILAIPLLISMFSKLSKEHEENGKKAKASAKAQAELAQSIGDSASKQITALTELQVKYKQLDGTLSSKNKFIKENKKSFEELGVSIRTVKDVENLLIEQADAYVASTVKRSMADASRAESMKAFSHAIQLRNKELVEGVDYKASTKKEVQQALLTGVYTAYDVRDEEQIAKNREAAKESYERQAEWYEARGKKMITDAVKYTNEANKIMSNADIIPFTEDKQGGNKEDVQKYGKEIADLWQKVYDDIATSKANAINNEFARTTELNVVNGKKELDELDKQIEAIKQKRIEQAKAEYVNKNGSDKGFVTPTITLTDEEKKVYEERAKQIIDNIYKLNEQAYKKLVGDYKTYEEKRAAIQSEYSEKRKQFNEEGLTENIEVLNKKEQEALDNLETDFAKSQSNYVEFVESLTDKKINELQLIAQELSNLLTTGDFSEEEKVVLSKMIEAVNDATKKVSKDGAGKEAEDTIKSLNEISKGVDNAINSLEGLDEKTKAVFQNISSLAGSAIKVGEGFIAMGKTGKEALSALDKASVILTIFSSLVSVTSKINEVFKSIGLNSGDELEEERAKARAAYERMIEAEESERRMNKLLGEQLQLLQMINIERAAYKESNIFGVESPYAQAIAGAEQYRLALQSITGQEDKLRDNLAYILGVAGHAGQGTTLYNVRQLLKDINLETELYDPNTFELNPSILAAYESLPKYVQDLIDNWDSVQEELMAAQEQILSNLQDLVGEMGNELKNSLVDAFRNGDIYSAVDDFEAYVNKMIEELMVNTLYAAVFGPLFDKLQARLEESMGTNGDQSITDDLEWFLTEYPQFLGVFGDSLQITRDAFEARGLSFLENQRTGTTGGFAAASQESIDELNGSFAAIQSHTYSIKDNTDTLRLNSGLILQELRGIKQDTSRLQSIEYAINDIKDHGVIIRA